MYICVIRSAAVRFSPAGSVSLWKSGGDRSVLVGHVIIIIVVVIVVVFFVSSDSGAAFVCTAGPEPVAAVLRCRPAHAVLLSREPQRRHVIIVIALETDILSLGKPGQPIHSGEPTSIDT